MAQARQVIRAFPASAYFLSAALVALIVLGAMVGTGTLNLFGTPATTVDGGQTNAALIEQGRSWELQRMQQNGYVDPLSRSGSDWERQRRQQAGDGS